MDSKVFQEALSLAELARKNGASGGTTLDPIELTALNADMGGRIPSWYIELMVKVPLANLVLGWHTEDDLQPCCRGCRPRYRIDNIQPCFLRALTRVGRLHEVSDRIRGFRHTCWLCCGRRDGSAL